ncbi:MAG: GDSL-type esterase/lipase family protein [bacterium]
MKYFWAVVLIGSIALNLVAVWGFFHYIKYGGSPLGELKRKLTGTTHQSTPGVPYADENAALLAEIENGTAAPGRIVFFGASITQRWDFDRAMRPEFNLINRGVGGQLVPALMARFQRDVLDLKPQAVIIKFCSINIRPQQPLQVLKDGMSMMTSLAVGQGITPIVATIIPAGKPEARIGDFSVVDSLQSFNAWVRQFAADHDYPLVDFASTLEDDNGFLPRDCSVDPVHLNDKGYQILEDVLRPVLAKVVKAPKPDTH